MLILVNILSAIGSQTRQYVTHTRNFHITLRDKKGKRKKEYPISWPVLHPLASNYQTYHEK